MSRKQPDQPCQLCQQFRALTFHHLIPRKLHRRAGFRRRYSSAQLNQGIYICKLCHNGLHTLYDEMTLARRFADLGALQTDAAVTKHIAWSAKQKLTQEN